MIRWTPEQTAVVEQAMQAKRWGKRMNYPALAAQLGMTVKAVEQKVYHIRRCLGLTEERDSPNHKWDDEKRHQIRQFREAGLSYREIANRFPGTSAKAIEKQYRRIVRGDATAPKWVNARKWNEQEDAALRHAFDSGLAWDAVASAVGRSIDACKARSLLLGMARRPTMAQRAIERIEKIEQVRCKPRALPMPESITASICGDPLPGRSALDLKRQGQTR